MKIKENPLGDPSYKKKKGKSFIIFGGFRFRGSFFVHYRGEGARAVKKILEGWEVGGV